MYQRPELLQRGDMQGDENLRAQIAAYLGEYRGVDCTADQVVVGAGVEYLLGCLAHLFAGSTAAVEKPRLQPHPRRTGKQRHPPAYRWKLTKAVCRSAR